MGPNMPRDVAQEDRTGAGRLESASWARNAPARLIYHGDRGSLYLSIRYSERLAEVGVASSVGSQGDSWDNALAEMIKGLCKTEIVHL